MRATTPGNLATSFDVDGVVKPCVEWRVDGVVGVDEPFSTSVEISHARPCFPVGVERLGLRLFFRESAAAGGVKMSRRRLNANSSQPDHGDCAKPLRAGGIPNVKIKSLGRVTLWTLSKL